jgi:large repetitive protein
MNTHLLLVETLADGRQKTVTLGSGAVVVVVARSHASYAVIDAQTRKTPVDLQIHRQGDDLKVMMGEEEVVKLQGFYNETVAAEYMNAGDGPVISDDVLISATEQAGQTGMSSGSEVNAISPVVIVASAVGLGAVISAGTWEAYKNYKDDEDEAVFPPPTTTISNIDISDDEGISAADFITNIASQTITGTLSAPLEEGEILYGSLNGGVTWIDITDKVSGTAFAWDGATLSGSSSIRVKVTNDKKKDGEIASQDYVLDTTAPATVVSTIDISDDSGFSDTDFITNIAAQTITATLSSGLTAGETLYGSVDGGTNWIDITDKVSGIDITWDGATLSGASASAIQIKVTDTAGNDGTIASQSYELDTLAPYTSIPDLQAASDTGSSPTDNITNDDTPTFTGVGEIGSLITLYDGATPVGTDTVDGSGNWSITSSVLSTGAHTLTTTSTDAAGNTSGASAGLSVTIDTTAPNAPGTPDLATASDSGSSTSDNLTNDNTPTLTGTGEIGSLITLYDGATPVGTATVDSSGNWSITSSVLTTGAHTLTATSTDAAGNTSGASAGLSVTIDTTAPNAPGTPDLATASDSGSSTSDNLTNDNTPTLTGTGEIGSLITLYDGATPVGTATVDSSGNWSITSSVLSTGAHTLTATSTDAAGNTSGASAGLSVTIDTTAPNAPGTPDLATASDSGSSTSDNLTNDNTPTLTGTGEIGSLITLYDGATPVGTATVDSSGNWSITSSVLSTGAHTLTTTSTDAAGNTSGASAGLSVTIDTTAPNAPGTPDLATASDSGSSTSDNLTNDNTPTLTGTGEIGSLITLYDGATPVGTATVDSSGNWSITSSVLSTGAHTLTATSTDAAGNTSGASAGLSVTIDTTAPNAPGTPDLATASDSGSSTSDNLTNDNTPTLTGTGEIGSLITLYDGATPVGTATVDGSGNWSITSSVLTTGAHTLTATSTDAAGNTSGASAGLSVTIDTTAPNAPGTPDLATASDSGSSTSDNLTNDNTPTLTGTGEIGSLITLYDGATPVGTATVDGSGNWSITSSVLSTGAHTLTATSTDAAGNTSGASAGLSVTIDTTAPTTTINSIDISVDTGSSDADFITNTASQTISATLTAGLTGGEVLMGSVDGGVSWIDISSELIGTALTWDAPSATLSGSSSIQIKVIDTAGNDGDVAIQAYVLDQSTPNAPGTPDLVIASDSGSSSSDNLTNDTTPTLTGTAEANSLVTLTSSVEGVVGSVVANGSGNWSITSSILSNGAHDLTAVSTDTAGNISTASSALTVTIDNLAPATPAALDLATASDSINTRTGTSDTDNITNDTTPTITGTGDIGSTITLSSSMNGVVGSAIVDGSGNWSITTSILSNAIHNLRATSADAAGNISALSNVLLVTIDSVATSTFSGASYDTALNRLTLTGTNMLTLASPGTDIKEFIDWSKLQWDIDSDDTDNITFTLADITSATVTNATTLNIVLSNAKAISLEGAAGWDDLTGNDSVKITAGFTSDAAGNVSKTDDFPQDSTAPTATITGASYDAATNLLTFTGTNFDTLLSRGESSTSNLLANIDWSKLQWDINNDNTGNITFTQADIISAMATNSTTLTVELSATKATSLEGTSGFGNVAADDTLQVTAGFLGDAAGNMATTDAYDGLVSAADTSIVVFDLVNGLSSDHSSRTFDAGTSYTIYVMVDSNSVALNAPTQWTGGANLGADDTVMLVGSGSAIKGYFNAAVTGSNAGTVLQWTSSSLGAAATMKFNGNFSRYNSAITSIKVLWSGSGSVAAGGFLTTLPAGIYTSQGLI